MIIEEVLTWMKKYKARRWSTYAEYYELLDQATQARDAYLAGRLSEEDALKAITSIFVSASLDRIDVGRTASVWKNGRGLAIAPCQINGVRIVR